jgi:hypothetical protein
MATKNIVPNDNGEGGIGVTGKRWNTGFINTITGNLTGDVTGNVSGTAATVTGAAQSNITSLGTLTGLNVTGAATFNDSVTLNGSRYLVQRSNDDSTIAFANNASGTPSSHVWAVGLNFSNSNAFTIAYGSGGIPSLESSKLVMTTSGNVGIGNTSPSAKLQIHTETNAGNAEVAAFLVNKSTTTNTEVRLAFAAHTNDIISTDRYSYISAKNTSGSNGQALVFATNATGAGGTERMVIESDGAIRAKTGSFVVDTSGQGIYLGGTGSANKLDDYEEGEWDPVYVGSGGSQNVDNGHYRKVGSLCYLSCSINVNSARTSGENSTISGLPFTAATATNMINAVSFFNLSTNFTGSNIPLGTIASGATTIALYRTSGTNMQFHSVFNAGQTGSIELSVTYMTA